MTTTIRAMPHPALGAVAIEVAQGHLIRLGFVDAAPPDRGDDPAADAVAGWLAAYLDGRDAPLRVPIRPQGTIFQRRVWETVSRIPWGATRTYGAIADELGTSARAVGRANGANPVLLAIPCHRVVGAAGASVGYAGGLDRKRWLLAHEGAASGLLFGC